jgi:hypothetical protein
MMRKDLYRPQGQLARRWSGKLPEIAAAHDPLRRHPVDNRPVGRVGECV